MKKRCTKYKTCIKVTCSHYDYHEVYENENCEGFCGETYEFTHCEENHRKNKLLKLKMISDDQNRK